MRRRDVIALFGLALAAYPRVAAAQQNAGMRRVGVLDPYPGPGSTDDAGRMAAFRQGMAALGWTEGRDLMLDVRYTRQHAERFPAVAAELVALKPDVLLAMGSQSVVALRRIAGRIPIVFVNVSDPVAQGFVHNLARPGGTITGFANYDYAMAGKWVQLLRDIAPQIKRVGVLYSRSVPTWLGFSHAIQAAAQIASIDTFAVVFEKSADITRVAALASAPATGLILLPGGAPPQAQDDLIKTAAALRLPVISGQPLYVARGGLMAYVEDYLDAMRRAAAYVDRILRGAKPGDLPVQNPTSFVLSINLKTAKQLGLTIPQSLLVSANELIR